ncbi:hypothetical protein [Rubinisphaera margarita]|uniref:hypothetical protein n=1 Tax=Rubinisphaera margarita TaxID=2909586 RepID=UPI001EE7D652|nr:hypothetical protein [Rubinisphaera margarita]MCG6156512.1 hypothetical protein [Rubinisphaera margarita]
MQGLESLRQPDLLIAFAVMLVASLVCFGLGYFIAGRLTRRGRPLFLSLVLIMGAIWFLWIQDAPWLIEVLQTRNVILYGNWLSLFAGLGAGTAFRSIPGSLARRSVNAGVFFLLGIVSLLHPLWGDVPVSRNVPVTNGICFQTSDVTCSPACAATVLLQHEIPATEAEMIQLCLTRKGTAWQGLYRGLALKTEGTPWRVEVFHGDYEDLKSLTPGWIILSVGLPQFGEIPSVYEDDYGWRRGDLHSVILREFKEDGYVLMVDPDVGEEAWAQDDLKLLYRGFGMRLVPR